MFMIYLGMTWVSFPLVKYSCFGHIACPFHTGELTMQ